MSRPPKDFAVQEPKGITPADLRAAQDIQARLLAMSIRLGRQAPEHQGFYAINRSLHEIEAAIKLMESSNAKNC